MQAKNSDSRKSQKMLAAVLATSPSFIFVIDQKFQIKFINRVPDGLKAKDVLGTSCLDYVFPENRMTVQAALDKTFRTGKPNEFQIQGLGPHGSVAWYMVRICIINSDPTTKQILLVSDDITTHKSIEEKLRRSEERYMLATNAGRVAVWKRDLVSGQFETDGMLEQLLGYAAGEFGSDPETWQNHTHPDDRAWTDHAMQEVIDGQTDHFDHKYRVIHKSGSPLWFSVRGVALRETGKPTAIIGTAIDVTPHVQAELEIKLTEQQLELALAGADLGFWCWDIPSGAITYNARYWEKLGYTPEQTKPSYEFWANAVHSDDLPSIQTAGQAHFAGETPIYQTEYRMRHKDGHWIWVLDRGMVLSRDEKGRPIKVAGTHLDVSDRKQLRMEGADLLRKIEELILRVDEYPRITTQSENWSAKPAQQKAKLTQRQQEVLVLIAAGMTSARIAKQLSISLDTVISHRRDLMRKLNLHSTAEVTRYAIRHKLIEG